MRTHLRVFAFVGLGLLSSIAALAAETDAPLIALGAHALRGIASACAVFTLPET